ncbi:MAG: protein translocase subunit SecF [Deltaproteobacteria bacterium]|nr:protein translocase subunit SecF [Deltaproteobacteria bacterium]
MEFISPEVNIDFVKKMKVAAAISCIIIVIGIISLIAHGGPRWGIEFKGGTSIQVLFKKPVSTASLRANLEKAGFPRAKIQKIGRGNEFVIYSTRSSSNVKDEIKEALKSSYGSDFEIRKVDMIGPKISKDLKKKGITAMVIAVFAILVYVGLRFQFRFATGAVFALIHDVLITITFLSLFNFEFTLDIIAALLMIIGYSLNDTIVVFDRIRERVRMAKKISRELAINRGINEVLSRTVLTSLTTLFVVLCLFFLGGGAIHGFAFALLVGIISGTYSSIFIASPVLLMFKGELLPPPKEISPEEKFKI